jgi:hypothetical protein
MSALPPESEHARCGVDDLSQWDDRGNVDFD